MGRPKCDGHIHIDLSLCTRVNWNANGRMSIANVHNTVNTKQTVASVHPMRINTSSSPNLPVIAASRLPMRIETMAVLNVPMQMANGSILLSKRTRRTEELEFRTISGGGGYIFHLTSTRYMRSNLFRLHPGCPFQHIPCRMLWGRVAISPEHCKFPFDLCCYRRS